MNVLTSIDQLDYLAERQRPVFDYICVNARKLFSDVLQELQNSRFGGMLRSTGAGKSPDFVRRQSLLQVYKDPLVHFCLGTERNLESNELQRRHTRPLKKKYNQSIVSIGESIIHQLKLILEHHESFYHIKCYDKEKIGMKAPKGVLFMVDHSKELMKKEKVVATKPLIIKEMKAEIENLLVWLEGNSVAVELPKMRDPKWKHWFERLTVLQDMRMKKERDLAEAGEKEMERLEEIRKANLPKLSRAGRVLKPKI